MKYLYSYKIFEKIKTVNIDKGTIEDINYIVLDLEDEGFNVKCEFKKEGKIDIYQIQIVKSEKPLIIPHTIKNEDYSTFHLSEVIPTVNRLKEMMLGNGIYFYGCTHYSPYWHWMSLEARHGDDDMSKAVRIKFRISSDKVIESKLFESQSDLEVTINDILIDIIDDDYYVETFTYNGVLSVDVGLFKGKTVYSPVTGQTKEVGELFTWDEIKEPMKRLFSYFDSIGLEYYSSMIDSGWNSHPFKIENDDFICIKDNGKECQKCIYQRPHVDLDKNIASLRILINVGKLNESFLYQVKHLKPYKIFESEIKGMYPNKMRSEIEYITDDLRDEGLSVVIGDSFPHGNEERFIMVISKIGQSGYRDSWYFNTSDFKNELSAFANRMSDFCNLIEYQVYIPSKMPYVRGGSTYDDPDSKPITLEGKSFYELLKIDSKVQLIRIIFEMKHEKKLNESLSVGVVESKLESIPGIPSKDIIGKESDVKDQIKNLHKVPKELKNVATTLTQYITNAKNGKISGLKLHPDLEKKVKDGGYPSGYSMGVDKDGYYIHTHRARSKSYDSPAQIPVKDMKFIDSTG